MNRTLPEDLCERARRNLNAYVDGELPEAIRDQLASHLERCASCAAEIQTIRSLKVRVRGLVRAQNAPPELAVNVRNRLRVSDRKPWWSFSALGSHKWAMAAAMAVVIGAGVWVAAPREPFPAISDRPSQNAFIHRISTKLAGVLRPGLADHVHCAVFRKYPVEPPSAATMLADLGKYRDLLPAVRAAVPSNWRVVMAHQCSYLGRKYVHVTLRDRDRLISLVIARKQDGESFAGMVPAARVNGVAFYQGVAERYRLAGFEAGEYLAYVVSDLGDQENLQAATLLSSDVYRAIGGIL